MDRPADLDLASQLFGTTPEHTLILLRAAWPAVAGPELARRTEVVSLERKVLRVRVPDTTWRRVLSRMRGPILRRLREVAGRVAPHSIAFVEGPLERPAPEPRPADPVPEPPTPLPVALVAAAESIVDPALRQGFLTAAGVYLRRFAASTSGATDPPLAPRR